MSYYDTAEYYNKMHPVDPKVHQWTMREVEKLGFKTMQNHNGWCRLRGWGFDVFHNFDRNNNTRFDFRSYANNYRGHFNAEIPDELAFVILIHCVGVKEK